MKEEQGFGAGLRNLSTPEHLRLNQSRTSPRTSRSPEHLTFTNIAQDAPHPKIYSASLAESQRAR